MTMKRKLIIWDFDGVISDTEHLWIKVWQDLLNERFHLGWDFEKANSVVGGIAPKTKIVRLKDLGIEIDEGFLKEVKKRDSEIIDNGLELVDGVEDVFKLTQFEHCIATGGNMDKTEHKIRALHLEKYFPSNHVFSAEQISRGKPEPDLFLFAAQSMGFTPVDTIVIEDSLAGLTAGLRAGMTTIAFVGCAMNNHPDYIEKIKQLGIKYIFFDMKTLLDNILSMNHT